MLWVTDGIKGKVEQSRERINAPLHIGGGAIEKGAVGSPSTTVANFTYFIVLLQGWFGTK